MGRDDFLASGQESQPANHKEWPVLCLLAALVLVVAEPIVFRGHVAVPIDNRAGLYGELESSVWPQLTRLSDINRFFIPKLDLQLNGNHVGWNATWNPHIQLGKPASHFGGYSKSYPITYVLSCFTRDPYLVHSLLGLVTLALLTFGTYLFLRSLGLQSAAAFIGAVGIGLNTRSAFWFGFAQFLSWAVWCIGVMWLSVRLTRRLRLLEWLGLIFCCYCLIIGARHQATIRAAYLVVPFVLLVVLRSKDPLKNKAETLAALVAAVLLSGVLSFPLVYDLLAVAADSTRRSADTFEFLLANRTGLGTPQLAMLWNLFAFGNPCSADFPYPTPALNFTPFFFAMLAATLVTRAVRRAWLFIIVAGGFLLMAACQPVHLAAIKLMGFGLSRGNPIGGIYLPAFVVCAYGVDTLLADRERRQIQATGPALAAVAATVLGMTLIIGLHKTVHIDWPSVAIGLVLAAAAIAFVIVRSPSILYAVAVVTVLAFTAPALIHRPVDDVARSSPLIQMLHDLSQNGHRYAKVGKAARLVPSNQEVLVDLYSIHSYDSLSSLRYGAFTRTISDAGVTTFGRHFDRLDNKEKNLIDDMSYTGVSVVISDYELLLEGWSVHDSPTGDLIYVASEAPPIVAQVTEFARVNGSVSLAGPIGLHARPGWATLSERRDNQLRVQTRAIAQPSLVFVSSQFHRDWVARSTRGILDTLPINDFYLGVILPPETSSVELRFVPLSRWAWLPLLFFAACLTLAIMARAAQALASHRADQ